MNKTIICFILLICLMISLCGCDKTNNNSAVDTAEGTQDMTASKLFEPEIGTSEPSSFNFQSEAKIDFDLLGQIFSMPQSEYDARNKDFPQVIVEYYGNFPEYITCYDFVIPESDVKCSAGMSYDDITGQLSQFSETGNINFTIYNSGPHEYTFYENKNELKTAVEYFLYDTTMYRFCFVFDDEKKLSYIRIYYPSFNGTDSMLNRRYFGEYSDICFKHVDDLTADDMSLLLNTKRSYIYSLYHFSSLELRSRIMNTFYYSAVGASPIVNTTIAYGSPVEGEEWTERLEEYPLFILINKGRFLGSDISSDFSTLRSQWGKPLYEGVYEDKNRDEIAYNYITYIFDDIMVICVGSEPNKENNIIIAHCLVLPRDNQLFSIDGVYKNSL